MKVLMLNGSPNEKGCTFTALSAIAQELNAQDIEAEIVHVGKKMIRGCAACGGCGETKRCAFDDGINGVLEKAEQADGIVFGAPVYFASPAGGMVAFMDRMFKAGSFCYKPGAVVATARRGGNVAALDVLMKYLTYNQMPVVSADYWPIAFGNTPEEVMKDSEGIFTMRQLGANMAWLLKSIEAGKKAGVKPMAREKSVWTNFIR